MLEVQATASGVGHLSAVAIATDGQTWAGVLGPEVILGRGGSVVHRIRLDRASESVRFDSTGGRVLLTDDRIDVATGKREALAPILSLTLTMGSDSGFRRRAVVSSADAALQLVTAEYRPPRRHAVQAPPPPRAQQRQILVVDTAARTLKHRLTASNAPVAAAAASPRMWGVTGNATWLIDRQSGKHRVLSTRGAKTLAFDPSGDHVVVADSWNHVTCFLTANGAPQWKVSVGETSADHVAFPTAGKIVAADTFGKRLMVLSASDGSVLQTVKLDVLGMAANGESVVVSTASGDVQVYRLK